MGGGRGAIGAPGFGFWFDGLNRPDPTLLFAENSALSVWLRPDSIVANLSLWYRSEWLAAIVNGSRGFKFSAVGVDEALLAHGFGMVFP